MKSIKEKYWAQKAQAKVRNLEFTLTFDEWWDIWQKSGKWEQRGRKKNQYVMSRIKDQGGYTLKNIFIQSNADNNKDAAPNRIFTKESFINRTPWNKGKKLGPLPIEVRQSLSNKLKGIPKPQSQIKCPCCNKIGGISNMKRWHFDNCKTKEVL